MWPIQMLSALALLVASTVAAHSLKLKRLDNLSKRAVEFLPLTAVHERLLYAVEIYAGNPPEKYLVVPDTGSSDSFLFDTQCGDPCKGRSLYDPTVSSTSVDTGEDFKLQYFDKAAVEGILYNDTIAIGSIQATEQAIGGATSFTGPFDVYNFPCDGILGLSFPETSTLNKKPVFDTMMAQGAVDNPIFGFKFTDKGGEFDLGAANPDSFTGDFAIVEFNQEGHWQIKLDALNVNGQEVVADGEVVVATGTALTYVSPEVAKRFHDQIPGSAEYPDAGEGIYRFPCDSELDITFTFAGTEFPCLNFSRGPVSEGSSDCISAIVGSGTDNVIRLGLMFLQNVYTVFSRDPTYVGFAKLA